VDGVGIGADDPTTNSFAAAAPLPHLSRLLQGNRLVAEAIDAAGLVTDEAVVRRLDATLGVDGRPQSGTGQATLLTGLNAAEEMGRHFGPWVPTPVRETLRAHSLFQVAIDRAIPVVFANSYPRNHFEPGGRGVRRPGAFPYAAHAAGVLDRDEAALRAGRGVASSITTELWRRHVDPDAPLLTAQQAGRTLGRISSLSRLTVFAHYDTDHAGHTGQIEVGVTAVRRLDEFLGGLLETIGEETLLMVTSDHGNIEDMSGGHTLNDVPLLCVGPGAEGLTRNTSSLLDVAPLVLGILQSGG
jgi:2,3-bisphosphoglycerate-independent phosphoglycerate mutase